MISRFFSLVLVSGILFSCGNSGKKEVSSKASGSEGSEKVEFASLIANPDSYVGKNITVEGKVVHVCTETGKKMFIVGDNPDFRLYVAAGENISKFPMELLGSEVTVEGLITKVAGVAKAPNEQMDTVKCAMPCAAGEAKKMNCETETALAKQTSLADVIMEYKNHTIK
jgi:hypothetical protein